MGDTPLVTRDPLYGRQLGDFRVRERLGEGGFGAVYRCDQLQLGREAVIKVLHRRCKQRDAEMVRFEREARLASRSKHPYAVHVYACGYEPDDGLLWIAMELVQGLSLASWLKSHGPMPLDQFVPFFEHVCEVVQTAHDRGIVHRDLKPSNIMLVENGSRCFPKLLDFGLAKLLDDHPALARGTDPELPATATEDTEVTGPSAVMGSPHYIAPELWIGAAAGPSADLYALGVVAYEAITGGRPFRGDDPKAIGVEHCSASIPAVSAGLPPGLNAVFARALAKLPEDRYGGALEFAAALRAESDGRLVAKLRTSARQWDASGRTSALLWRDELLIALEQWSQRTSQADAGLTATDIAFIDASRDAGAHAEERLRHRAARARRLGIAASTLMVAIVVGMVQGRAMYETRLAQQRVRDAQELARATAVTAEVEQGRAALLHDDLAEAQAHLGEAWRRGDHSGATAFMYARALQPLRAELARLPAASGRMWSASWSPDGRQIVTTDDGAAQIWIAETHQLLFALPHDDTVYDARYTADGRRVVTACGDGAVRVWSTETGALVRELRLHGKTPWWALVAVDGPRAAAIDFMGAVAAAWDITTGAQLAEFGLDGMEWLSVAFSADGRWLAAGGGDSVQVVDTASWRRAAVIPGPRIHAAAWDPMRPHLVTGGASGDVAIWDIPSGTRARHLRELGDPVDAVAVSPDGALIAVASRDGAEQVFAGGDGTLVSRGNYLHTKIFSIGFDPLSSLVVSAGTDGSVAVSEALAGLPLAVLEGPASVVRTARFGPNSRRVVGASWDGTARVWDADTPYRRWTTPAIADDCGLVGGAVADGPVLAVACTGHPTRVWDTTDNQLLAELPPVATPSGDAPAVYPVAVGDHAAIARGNAVELYELPGVRPVRTVVHRAAVTAIGMGTDGTLVSGAADGSVLVGGAELAPAPGAIDAVALLSGGRVAAADARGHVRVLDRAGVTADITLPARARFLRPSPDGRVVLAVPRSVGLSAPPVLLDPERSVFVARLDAPQTYGARWVDGGRAILTAHADGAARLWAADGKLLRTYHGGARFLADADLDGSMVVGGGGDGMLRFWDRQSGRELWVTPAHRANMLGVHADRGDVVTRGSAGELARWHLPDSATVITADFGRR